MDKKKLGKILIIVGLVVIAVFIILGVVGAVGSVGKYNDAVNDPNFDEIKGYIYDSSFEAALNGFLEWGLFAIIGVVSTVVGIVLNKKGNK